jgi:Tol biopolymer transport system component
MSSIFMNINVSNISSWLFLHFFIWGKNSAHGPDDIQNENIHKLYDDKFEQLTSLRIEKATTEE